MIGTVVFGLSTSFTATLAIMKSITLVEPEERDLAGMIIAFVLSLGLTLGASLSFGLQYLYEL